jgi:hypothetical protein
VINRKRKFVTFAASLLVFSGVVVQSNATTLLRMDLNTLTRSAEIIARVRCVHSETRWESESIWTFDDFDVLETFKGAPPQTLRVRLPGGRVDRVEVKIEGVPAFTSGEEVILFVERTSAGDYGVTSWAQGTFRIRRSADGGALLTQDTSHISVFDPRNRQFAPIGIRNLPMSEFRQQLAQALISSEPMKQQR